MWERFTQHGQRTILAAQEEAGRFGGYYISPEHLLLGLLREAEAPACRLLSGMGVSLDGLRAETESRMAYASEPPLLRFTLTPRTSYVIDLAGSIAQQLQNRYIGTEHLLMALVIERNSLAGRMLAKSGVEAQATWRALTASLGHAESAACFPAVPPPITPKQPQCALPPAMEELLEVLRKEHLKRDPRSNRFVAYLCAGTLVPIGVIMLIASIDMTAPFLAFLALMLLVCGGSAAHSLLSRTQREAAIKLAQFKDRRLLHYLMDFLCWQDSRVQTEAKIALTHLLPQLQASDARLFNQEQRNLLYAVLTPRNAAHSPDFVIAVLKALEQIGDPSALPAVHRLARYDGPSQNRRLVREAAEACLPFLQDRAMQQTSRQTLLRPARATPLPDTLLRPAETAPEIPASELLRPTEPEPSSNV